jgi:hypothetical protein
MGRFSEKLASMYLTAWNMVAILVLLGWGLVMAGSAAFEKGFWAMNSVLIRDWLMSQDGNSYLLKLWFIGLCLLMTLLGINLIFCSWEKIYRIIRAKFSFTKFYMLIVHALFGLVALFHIGGLMLGYEQNDIMLGNGMSCILKNGYEIKVNSIHFAGNVGILDKTYRSIKKEDLDYKMSYVEVILSQNGRELCKDNIYIFKPLKYGNTRVTLKSFISPAETNQAQINATTTPWIKLTATKNPVLSAFLIIYPFMIAGILIHLILTWRSLAINRAIQETSNSN